MYCRIFQKEHFAAMYVLLGPTFLYLTSPTLYFHDGTDVSGSLLLFNYFSLSLNFPHPQAGGRDCFSVASPCVFAPNTHHRSRGADSCSGASTLLKV